MLGGADHIENDSPSEHGNETPHPRTRSPSASTTIDYRSPTARTATTPTRPAKPSRRRRRYQLDNTVLRASTPGIQLRLTPRYHHRDHKARVHPEWNDIVRGEDTGTGWLKVTCMRECQEAIRQNCFPSFTGRNQSGWRYLPSAIDGVPVLKVIPDEFDDSEDEEFYNAARRHSFDQLMLRRDAQIRFWRSAAPRDVRAEEPCIVAVEEAPP